MASKIIKRLFSGIIGAAVFLSFAVFAFSLVKMIFMLRDKPLILSKYNIAAALLVFIAFGFFYGISCYNRKNQHYKVFRPKLASLLITFVLSAGAAFIIFLVLNYKLIPILLNSRPGLKVFILLLIMLFVLFYLFSATFLDVYHSLFKKRKKLIVRRNSVFLAILFNPFLMVVYFGLFMLVVYNAFYIPCGVYIVGVEKNANTANTLNLDITPWQRIVAIDDVKINSMSDVRSFLGSLDVTKEIVLETEKNQYYINTYTDNGRRYLGLLLTERACRR